ncbi:MAG TPA: 3'-5' exonuclease [Rhizomicrobium sp.]|jgi:inhibitor of KinA sporulation pathway (predicted exonuclease)
MQTAILYDLEFTAWEGSMARRWLEPGEFREVVQIGAVKIDAATLETIAELNVLLRPRINKVLSAYFEELTGITNAMLAEHGVDFREAYSRFVAFAGAGPILSFGRDDVVLTANLALYGIHDALSLPVHRNIVPWLNQNGVMTKGRHSSDVARLCGVAFEGRAHDALDDARSLLAGSRALIAKGARNMFLDESA